ncbi:hypothetical protein DFH27DRAFT_179792 [Peziza echinospora]|nr:hypothetical protein DFH27DRAFT_179792 [Peziza echinospora]
MELNKYTKILLLLAILTPTALAQQSSSTTASSSTATTRTSTSAAVSSSTTRQTTSSTSTGTRSTGVPPSITTSADETTSATRTATGGVPPPMPTLGNGYPAPTIPPTAGAPFMQKSSLPEGTFFIAVGAALGFLLFSVFAWRAIVAWSLHRSVKRAAEQANKVDTKAPVRTAPSNNAANFYSAGAGSALSLGDLGGGRAGSKQTPNSSLFFSPTAGVSAAGGDRRSAYLPSGYYAAGGNASGGLGGPMNNSQTHFHSQSVSSRYGYGGGGSRGGVGPSPPGSPSMPPSRGGGGGSGMPQLRTSQSNNSLAQPPVAGQRAPSAYLEDLFEHHQQKPGRY